MSARVYLITNLVNGKRYVGSTKLTLEKRWWGHCYDARRQSTQMPLHDAIRKYGSEQFRIELLEEFETRPEAYDREDQLISELGTHVSLGHGYNVLRGSRFGATKGMTGKKHSCETKRRQSEAAMGRKHTQASKDLMSRQRAGVPRGPYVTSKLIEQLDRSGNVIATFRTLTEACMQFNGRGRSHIWSCCVGKRKHAQGFRWRYVD